MHAYNKSVAINRIFANIAIVIVFPFSCIHRYVTIWFSCGIEYNNSYCHINDIITIVAVLFPTCGFLVGMMVQRAINRKMRLDSNAVLADDPLPTSVTQLTPVYEEDILPPEKQKKIELQAYGPVSQPRT